MSQNGVESGRVLGPRERGPDWNGPSRTQEGVDPSELWSTLRDGRGVILRIAVLFFLGVAVLTLGSRMEFESRTRLYLGELGATPSSGDKSAELDLSSGDQSGLATETQILQSDALITQAILSSGLNVAITPAGWRAPRYAQWLLAKKDPKLVDVTIGELAAINTRLDDDYRGAQSYRILFVTDGKYEVWTRSGLFDWGAAAPQRLSNGKLGEPTKIAGLNLTLTSGTARGPKAGATYDIKVMPLDEVVAGVSKALSVESLKPIAQEEPTKVVSLVFRHSSPHLAAKFLQQLTAGYLEAHQSWKIEDATAAEAFVSGQLGVIREALDKTEKKLADYRSNTRVVVLDGGARAMVEQIGKYEEQRIAARLQVASLMDMKRALKNPKARMEAYLMGEGDDTVLENLASSLSKAREDLATLEQRFNSAAPDVRQQRAQVDAQLDMVRNYVTNRLTRAQGNVESLGQVVGQYEKKLKTVPSAELGLAQLARESEVYSKIYSFLLERQQQTAIVKASRVSKNRVLDAPDVPYRAASPKLLTRLAVSLFGSLLGCAFVVLRRVLSPNFQSAAEVRGSSRLPIFASVPRRPRLADDLKRDLSPLDTLVGDPNSEFAESFRMLRTNLYYSQRASGGQVILVTSPKLGDGKTTTVFSLAAMLAADHKTVLVIDADLRKPTHHSLLRQAQSPGLSGVLAGRGGWFDAVRSHALGIHTMAAGLSASSDLLSSEQLAALVTETRTIFDFILLDVPSFPRVSDALMLCEHADCVLSVVRLRSTPRKLAMEHIERLSGLVPSYGIVINDVGVAVVAQPSDWPERQGTERVLAAKPADQMMSGVGGRTTR